MATFPHRSRSHATFLSTLIAIALSSTALVAGPSGAIVNGATEVTQPGSWPWLVGVEIDANGSLVATCSGVMVGPTTVLTAAHCVDPAELGFTPSAADILVSSDRDLLTAPPGDFVAVTSYVENPAFVDSDIGAGHDETVLQLATEPPGVSPLPILQPADVAPFSTAVTGLVAGYGLTVANNRNSAGVVYQTEVVGASYGTADLTVRATPAYTCFGDSGGPLVVNLDGATVSSDPSATNGSWALIGLTSYGDANCASFDGFTNVVSDYGFIAAETPFVAAEPYDAVAPTLAGSALVGATLSCDSGSWNGAPTLSYQWLTIGQGGGPIAGATASTYSPSAAEIGASVACEVSAVGTEETISADSSPLTIFATVPGAPSQVAVTARDGAATVSFVAPESNGGSAITSYLVASSPGGVTSVGLASPLTVRGLKTGRSYTFTVAATNAFGTGSPSLASNLVTVPAGTVTIEDASRLALSGRTIDVRIRCTTSPCQGSARLIQRVKERSRHGSRWVTTTKVVVLASGSFDLQHQATSVMRLALTKAGRRTLASTKGHPLSAQLEQLPLGGKSVTRATRVLTSG